MWVARHDVLACPDNRLRLIKEILMVLDWLRMNVLLKCPWLTEIFAIGWQWTRGPQALTPDQGVRAGLPPAAACLKARLARSGLARGGGHVDRVQRCHCRCVVVSQVRKLEWAIRRVPVVNAELDPN